MQIWRGTRSQLTGTRAVRAGDATGYQLQQSFENAIRYRRPAAVIIDEAQHLARMACGRKLSDQLDVIKSIASRTQTVQVLIGTYELLAFRNLSGQLSRRSVDLHFLRYRAEEQTDVEIFQSIVFTFQAQLPIGSELDLCGVWDFLYERSLGCVGILKDWLMRAVITAARSGGKDLTKRVLEKSALSASQCEKILAEARDGELRLADNGDAESRLRRLLNLDSAEMTTVRETPGQPAVERSFGPNRRRNRPVAMRDPKRDPIGQRGRRHMRRHTVYESWDLDSAAAQPQRTYLYHMRPLGIGAMLVESLTGYIARLAEAHDVSTAMLLNRELLPRMGTAFSSWVRKAKVPKNSTFLYQSHVLNGAGEYAQNCVQVLETLTGFGNRSRDDPAKRLGGILSVQRSLEDANGHGVHAVLKIGVVSGRPIYEPLLWAIEPVSLVSGTSMCPVCAMPALWAVLACTPCRRGPDPDTAAVVSNEAQ